MPVLEAVQTFAGITNENEFYSHHYLAEVFKNDVKERLDAWDAAEAEHAGDDAHRAPSKRLQSWAQRWFALRGQVQRAHEPNERWHAFAQMQSGLLQAELRSIERKGRIVFFPREPLFLRSGDDPAIHNQSRGTVVIEG